MSDDYAYTYSSGLARSLMTRFQEGSVDAEDYPKYATVLAKIGFCDFSVFVFIFLVKKNIACGTGFLAYAVDKFKLVTDDVETLVECVTTFVDDDFGLQAAYCQNTFTDPKITRLSVLILGLGLNKLASLPWRIGNDAFENGLVTANTPKYAPSFRWCMQCAYADPDYENNRKYAMERSENIRTEFRCTEDDINHCLGFVRNVVLGPGLLPVFESILRKPSLRMHKQDTIWGFGAKKSAYEGFFIGQLLTYVYAVEDDGTKQTTEATVQDLVHSGIKIAYKDSAGKLFTEVVKFGKCKEKFIVSSSDPDRYDQLPSGIVLKLLCILKKKNF